MLAAHTTQAQAGPPENGESQAVGAVLAPLDQSTGDIRDGTEFTAERKARATLKAYAARGGCTVHELAGGGFLLTRWSMSRELPDLRAVAVLLKQMGMVA